MVKILIIGGPGSGKTTFARKLSYRLNMPCFDLDDIFWNNEQGKAFTQKRSEEERLTLLNTLLNTHRSWIMEGVYTKDWVQPVYEQANHIFYINTNLYLRHIRIIKRYLTQIIHPQEQKHKGSFYSLIQLLIWNQTNEQKRIDRFKQRLHQTQKTCYKLR